MPPRLVSVLAAVILAALGVGAAFMGMGGQPARVRTGANTFVNRDRPGINAHNSPAVAADPARPALVAVADRIDTPRFSCSVALSANGGQTWRPLPLPLAPDAPNCFWPDVAFDDRGQLLVLYTATGGRFNLPVGVWLQRFQELTPAGPAVRVAGGEAFHARLAVQGSRVAVTWVQAGPATAHKGLGFSPPPNPIVLVRSDDGGRRFSEPARVSEPHRLVAQPTVVLGPGDEVLVGALDLGDDLLDYEARHEGQGGPPAEGRWRVVVWRSSDGGASFLPASVVADDLIIPQRIIVDLAPAPSFARRPDGGRTYAAWDAGRGDQRDVFLAWSDDGGSTWTAPTQVSSRPQAQFLPAVGVAGDGRLDVIFYDRSRDPTDVMTEVTLASSWDGGRSFTPSTLSDRPFDSGIGLGSAQGIPLLGSQLAVLSEPGRALAFWADTRQGTVANNVQDLAAAVVKLDGPGARRWPLVALGGVLLAAAAGAVGLGRPPPLARGEHLAS